MGPVREWIASWMRELVGDAAWEWAADWVWLVPVVSVAILCLTCRLRESLADKSESWWRNATAADVKAALDRGADVNAWSGNPLRHAARYVNDIEVIKLLLDRGANVNTYSYHDPSALHSAVDAGNLEVVTVLLDRGAEPNALSKSGTPLHHAVRHGASARIINLLLDRGADPCGQSYKHGDHPLSYKHNTTPLYEAINSNNLEAIAILLDKGADPNAHDRNGTPLHKAVETDNLQAAGLLISKGADINEYRSGGTPFHHAARQGNLPMAEFLLDQGADGTLPDYWEPLSTDVKALLINRGIKPPIFRPQHRRPQRRRYSAVETGRKRRPARYALSAIPTMFDGRQYRSRLEARWAAFLSLCEWEHEYEPLDLNGWIPDFAIWGEGGNTVWVEIKPVVAFPKDVAQKMEDGLPVEYRDRGDELLILGTKPSPAPRSASSRNQQPRIGWLARTMPRPEGQGWTWGDCVFGRWAAEAPFGFCYPSRPYHDRITGMDSGVRGGSPGATGIDLARLWAEAGNLVQWRSPRDS